MKKLLSLPLALVLVVVSIGRTAFAQQRLTAPTMEARVKAEINKRRNGDQSHVTIELHNGSELKGWITQTSENMFTLREDRTRMHRDINYADVARVKGSGLSKGAKLGILTAIITGVFVIGVLINQKHFDPFEHGVLH